VTELQSYVSALKLSKPGTDIRNATEISTPSVLLSLPADRALAGLQGVNPDLYEAAALDGASPWQKFWYVTLPQLRPTTFFVTVMLTIQCFKVYDIFLMITNFGPGGKTRVLVGNIYEAAFTSRKFGYSSAMAMILFILVLIVTLIQFRGEKSMNE